MTRRQGTEQVDPGLYVSFKHLSFEQISQRGPLPGSSTDAYYRVPMIAMFLAAPILGLVYVMFLPLIGFIMVGYLLGGKSLELAGNAARQATRVMRPGWEPSLAFLHRSKPAKPANQQPETTDEWAKSVESRLNESGRHGS